MLSVGASDSDLALLYMTYPNDVKIPHDADELAIFIKENLHLVVNEEPSFTLENIKKLLRMTTITFAY